VRLKTPLICSTREAKSSSAAAFVAFAADVNVCIDRGDAASGDARLSVRPSAGSDAEGEPGANPGAEKYVGLGRLGSRAGAGLAKFRGEGGGWDQVEAGSAERCLGDVWA